MRLFVRLLLLSGLLLLVSACATPIGVARVDTQSVYRSLTASVLSTGQPSAATEQVLVRTGLAQQFQNDPEATLAALRGTGVGLSRDRLFALAELSFVHAEDIQKPEYYLAAAVYAYAFLFPTDGTERDLSLNPIDPRLRLAADLYNLGLTLGLSTPKRDRVLLEAGTQAPALRHPDSRHRSGAVPLGRIPNEWLHPGGRVQTAWAPQSLPPAWRGRAAGGGAAPGGIRTGCRHRTPAHPAAHQGARRSFRAS